MKELIQKHLYENGKLVSRRLRISWLKSNCPELLAGIMELTNFMPSDIPISSRIVLIESDITSAPICKICESPTKVKRGRIHQVCSSVCAGKFNALNPNHAASMQSIDRQIDGRARRLSQRHRGEAVVCVDGFVGGHFNIQDD